jgi:beta-lactamase class D
LGRSFTPQVGWFAGYTEKEDQPSSFAANIEIVKPEDTQARTSITRTILCCLGLIE